MKKVFLLLVAAGGALSAIAQTMVPGHTHLVDPKKPKYAADSLLAPWVIDVNLLGGALTQDLTTKNTSANYPDGQNVNTGKLKFVNGFTLGGDAQIGYFFGKKHHWGIGTGFMYLYQQGDMKLDGFHAEYKAVDNNGDTYRQIISSREIKETVKITNINIPLVAKYKTRFSKTLGFTADAGLLFNLQERNMYKTNASFDYEAAYLFNTESNSYVYDAGTTLDPHDVLFTRAEIDRTNHVGTTAQYFDNLRNVRGYNVGLDQKAKTDNGSVSYTTPSVGFILQPSLNVFLSDNVALNFGLYYIYQNFSNKAENAYRLTNRVGDYNSSLNTVTAATNQSYGLNLGVRFLFGRRAPMVADEDTYDPTMCGNADGRIAINGLHHDDSAVVTYYKDGVAQTPVRTMTDSDGTITLNNLPAGKYDTLIVTMRKRHATAIDAMLVDPPMSITFEGMTNPTAYDKCDGTITLNIARPGKAVMVSYMLDGAPKSFNGTIGSDNRVMIGGLCGGKYTGIKATIGNCSAMAVDATLITPAAPPPPPPPPAPVVAPITVSTPILFEVNKTIIREDSHPVIELAVQKLNEDKSGIVIVNGYTDATGRPAYNKALSIRRANAVKKELMKMGIKSNRIKIVGHGSSEPAADNGTAEGRTLNRRAVMHLNIGE